MSSQLIGAIDALLVFLAQENADLDAGKLQEVQARFKEKERLMETYAHLVRLLEKNPPSEPRDKELLREKLIFVRDTLEVNHQKVQSVMEAYTQVGEILKKALFGKAGVPIKGYGATGVRLETKAPMALALAFNRCL